MLKGVKDFILVCRLKKKIDYIENNLIFNFFRQEK
jgi:hypothetical protein